MTRSQVLRSWRAGFTLMEVMLVMVILVIIGSLAVATYSNSQRKAKLKAAKAQIDLFDTPLEMYQLDMDLYPTTDQGLEALRAVPTNVSRPDKWEGPYLDKPVPDDPWDRPYQYLSPGIHNVDSYDIWSLGPDGVESDDDIRNWEGE